MPRIFDGIDDFRTAVGESLPAGPWLRISQDRIDAFADVTEDWQWIHVDTDRAAASGIGATVAHGYLTLSLVPRLSSQVFDFVNIGRALNYGLDKVRFPAMVHPGDRIRARARVASVEDASGGTLARVGYTIEIEGRDRPACVLDALMLVLPPT